MASFKCSMCLITKSKDNFGLNKLKERSKTCTKCDEKRTKWNETKKNFIFVLNDNWKTHPDKKYKNYRCDELGHVINVKTKKLVGTLGKNGYVQLCVCVPELEMILAHRFVYECHHGIIPDDKVINHINENKCDNRIENIECVTKSENNIKSTKKITGRRKPTICIGINQTTKEEFKFKSLRKACMKTGCCSQSIQRICDGVQNLVASTTSADKWIFKYV